MNDIWSTRIRLSRFRLFAYSPTPLPCSPFRVLTLVLSLPVCRRSSYLSGEGEGDVSYDSVKAWSSINHSVLADLIAIVRHRRTLDVISSKCYFYYTRCYEILGKLAECRHKIKILFLHRYYILRMFHLRRYKAYRFKKSLKYDFFLLKQGRSPLPSQDCYSQVILPLASCSVSGIITL